MLPAMLDDATKCKRNVIIRPHGPQVQENEFDAIDKGVRSRLVRASRTPPPIFPKSARCHSRDPRPARLHSGRHAPPADLASVAVLPASPRGLRRKSRQYPIYLIHCRGDLSGSRRVQRAPCCMGKPLSHSVYSITSSARANSIGGTSMPRAPAVFKLITKESLVGCCTGKSAAFSPRRILPT